MINEKYSYNGYNPDSKVTKEKKAELLKLFNSRILNRKQYSAAISDLKRCYKYKSLVGVDPAEFNNTEIIGTSFAQREPFTDVLPEGATNCILTNCNTNNCNIPKGFTINGGVNEHHKKQNNGEEWIVDDKLKPQTPLSPKQYDKYGLSKDPKNLPVEKLSISILLQAEINKKREDRKNKILEIVNDPSKLDKLIKSGKEL